MLLSPRHQRPAQPRTATPPTWRDERPVLRERVLSAPNISSPALGMNLNLGVPLSPRREREAIFEQPAPIALAVDTLPSPSMDLPAAPASPFSDDEPDVLAPAAAVLDTSSTPHETYGLYALRN
ncbi:hypothetical protein AURDEDRAFT_175246 [Auricularia subglabra TFB-10046 SS5]|nr:hypothetical protein AURDEDRAFT_175246 [Auricularia subglabra TFB-10046 SS5]